jgi:hypothetical protein
MIMSVAFDTMLTLPKADGTLHAYRLAGTPTERPSAPPQFNRIAYAAAHIVSDPQSDTTPWNNPALDWDATMAFRHHLWSLGFKIAEAMDTSQRGMGLNWAGAQELIRRSLAESKTVAGADLACGAGTDHLDPADAKSPCPYCAIPGRLCKGLWAHSLQCPREGRAALAGRDVRPAAQGLLGKL